MTAALGRIQDADYAAEITALAKHQILQKAAMAMLAQANASKGYILTLLRSLNKIWSNTCVKCGLHSQTFPLSPGSKDDGLNTKKDPVSFAGWNTKMWKPS